ncbi:MAG: methyltransferase domain-containing protein [Deltaproteobacteria bacterium]|nr:methyltransferase domain-containing protein [Deltaproteobacteria bacterium]
MKLHLGCGTKYIPGYDHIDVLDLPHIQIRHSIDSLPMIQDESVEVIYACHVLEHFLRQEVPRVLQEWHRILRTGGILRLAVPDFAAICRWYVQGGSLKDVMGLLFGGQTYLYNFHHIVFDHVSLQELLLQAGFSRVHGYDWRTTEHADLDDYSQAYLPYMDKEHGLLMSLNVEAVK